MSNLWMQFAGEVSDDAARAYNLAFPKSLMPPPPIPGETPFIPRAMVVVGDEPYDAALTWDDAISGYRISVPNLGNGTVTGAAGISSENYIIQWVFDAGSIPSKGMKFAARFTADVTRLASKVYALFGMRFSCTNYAAMSVYKTDTGCLWTSAGITVEVRSNDHGKLESKSDPAHILDSSGKQELAQTVLAIYLIVPYR
jgi:hypothetical protein